MSEVCKAWQRTSLLSEQHQQACTLAPHLLQRLVSRSCMIRICQNTAMLWQTQAGHHTELVQNGCKHSKHASKSGRDRLSFPTMLHLSQILNHTLDKSDKCGECRVMARFQASILSVTLSSDGRLLAVACAAVQGPDQVLAPEITIWDLQAGICRHTLLHSTALLVSAAQQDTLVFCLQSVFEWGLVIRFHMRAGLVSSFLCT